MPRSWLLVHRAPRPRGRGPCLDHDWQLAGTQQWDRLAPDGAAQGGVIPDAWTEAGEGNNHPGAGALSTGVGGGTTAGHGS
eukprot:15482042-Alexandrium_andersonii.AAC.1